MVNINVSQVFQMLLFSLHLHANVSDCRFLKVLKEFNVFGDKVYLRGN